MLNPKNRHRLRRERRARRIAANKARRSPTASYPGDDQLGGWEEITLWDVGDIIREQRSRREGMHEEEGEEAQ